MDNTTHSAWSLSGKSGNGKGIIMQQPTQAGVEVLKAAPSVTVGGMTVAGVPLSDWVLILTAIYTILQIGFLLRDKVFRKKEKHDGSK